MKLSRLLAPERVRILDASTKREAIERLLDLFRQDSLVSDFDVFAEAIWQREEVLPTGVGLGIGVPHVRTGAVRLPAAALAVLRNAVDYGSLDGAPVRIVLMIGMPENTHNDYLVYLARASRLLADTGFREGLLACADEDALWNLVKDR